MRRRSLTAGPAAPKRLRDIVRESSAPRPPAEARPGGRRPPQKRGATGAGNAHGTTAERSQAVGPRGIVFLDFDNTLIHGDAGPLFGWYLFLWRRHELEGHPWKRLRLWLRYLPFMAWMGLQTVFYKLGAVRRSTIVRAAYKGLRGVEEARFTGLMRQFADEAIVPRIYPSMLDEVRRHLEAGRPCVVLTTGIEPLVRHVLDRIDPRMDLIGCRMKATGGRLTGRVDGPLYGVDKANILHAYARALGLDTRDCWAYSDHLSDIHMLEAVGHAVAVNPRGRLRRLALQRGWAILRPRLPPAGPADRQTATA